MLRLLRRFGTRYEFSIVSVSAYTIVSAGHFLKMPGTWRPFCPKCYFFVVADITYFSCDEKKTSSLTISGGGRECGRVESSPRPKRDLSTLVIIIANCHVEKQIITDDNFSPL